jgi:DNA repair protein RadA/Sms
LRTVKNRFGSASELGVYEMTQDGLREVSNPSEILISERDSPTSGVGIAATIEGARPLLVEIQSLVSTAVYGNPQRSATGFDTKRMNMLLAVLEKRCGFKLGAKDVFLNITGGIKINDTAIDLAVVCSILSSDQDISLDTLVCFAGEIGLSGEIRAVNRIENRIKEAEKLGYKKIIISKYNKLGGAKFNIEVHKFGKIEELFRILF